MNVPQPDRLLTAPAPRPAPAPAKAVVTRPAAAPARFTGDTRVKTQAAEPEPELLAAPKGATGWVRALWNMMFGNTENKLFQIKFNLIHFKDILMGFMQMLQSGPLAPLFTLTDKVGAFLAGTLARLNGSAAGAESGVMSRAFAGLGRMAAPVANIARIAFKWLERAAPVFGLLVAVQDLYKAAALQGDAKVSGDRKVFAWATFLFSAVGATASTIAAWSALGAVIAVPVGIGSVGLGTVAIVCFGLSLLTGWLGSRLAKEKAGVVKPVAAPAQGLLKA